jgi:predicted nucleotidyltransferase
MQGTDFSTFRRRVIANIEADLAREDEEAESLRAEVVPLVAESVAAAREAGRCGKAWLFGSFAWGRPTERSDVDLLVTDCKSPDGLAAEVWRRVERPVHVVPLESAAASLVQRVLSEGQTL